MPYREWQLDTRHVGRRVRVFSRLESTNTYALSLPEDDRHNGIVILAEEQTAGRGQPGHNWHCPPGEGRWQVGH